MAQKPERPRITFYAHHRQVAAVRLQYSRIYGYNETAKENENEKIIIYFIANFIFNIYF